MKKIKEDIKNRSFQSVYLLCGEEEYLKRLYRDKLKKAVIEDGDEMNFSLFEGKETNPDEVRAMADTLPFFSDYRLILIENSGWFKSAGDFSEYLPKMPESTILVFMEKEIDKRNKLYKFVNSSKNMHIAEINAMDEKNTKLWIGSILKENDRVMKNSVLDYFLNQVEGSMTNIQNELDKLIAYTQGRQEITNGDIDQVCCVQITGKIFALMDAVAEKNIAKVMYLYRDLLALQESPMSILYLLTRHFNILLQVKMLSGQPGDTIAQKIGVRAFTIRKYSAQCRQFTVEQLKKMLDECIETEYQFKRGNVNDQTGVELLLVTFAKK